MIFIGSSASLVKKEEKKIMLADRKYIWEWGLLVYSHNHFAPPNKAIIRALIWCPKSSSLFPWTTVGGRSVQREQPPQSLLGF